MKYSLILCTVLLSLANRCADTLQFAPDQAVSKLTTSLGGGVYEVDIDATSVSAWSYYNFETLSLASVADPMADSQWDLGFQRFYIKLNGGASGNGNAAVVPVIAGDFDSTVQAPDFSAARQDSTEASSGGDCNTTGTVLFAFLDDKHSPNHCWFDYDQTSHKLTPKNTVYFVRTAQPKYFKVKIMNYYSATGTPAVFKFRFAEVTAP